MNILCIAGFLGSGKTTVLLEVARAMAEGGATLAVIENEIGEVGIVPDQLARLKLARRSAGHARIVSVTSSTLREGAAGSVHCVLRPAANGGDTRLTAARSLPYGSQTARRAAHDVMQGPVRTGGVTCLARGEGHTSHT